MPIISDLIDTLSENPDTVRLAKIIKLLTIGNGEHFNGKTNVDVNNKFVVIGLQHNSEEMLPLAIFAAFDFCLSKILEDRRQRKFLMIDESWKIIMEPSGYGCRQIVSNSRLLRAAECAMFVATQNMSSIVSFDDGKNAREILNNCPTKILMNLTENEAFAVQDLLDLTPAEVDQIRRFSQGQALLLAGETRLTMSVVLSETEKLLIYTDRGTLDRAIRLKEMEVEKKREAENAEGEGTLDTLIDWDYDDRM